MTQERILNIDGVINFRDLGGYLGADGRTLRWGKLYRSGQLDRLSTAGIQTMMGLGVQTVVDLRFDDEAATYPTIKAAFPTADFISWRSEIEKEGLGSSQGIKRSWREALDSGDPAQVREAMRVNYPVKLYSHKDVYREMLLRILNQDVPLVFHCAAGKDRTGVAAALILSLAGVSNQEIVKDYLISQGQVKHLLQRWAAGGATGADQYDDFQRRLSEYPRDLVQPVFDADVAYINTLLEYVANTYQSFENYALTTLEMSGTQLATLRERLLV